MIEVIERTAKEASHFFQNFLTSERTVYQKGFLQGVDSRVKIPSFFILIVLAVSTFNLTKLFPLLIFLLFLAFISKISLKLLVSRVWLFTLFTFIIVTPKIFYPFFTMDGLIYALTFTLRVLIAITSVSLIILSTPFSDMVSTLRAYRLPSSMITILVLTYRYIHLTFSELFRILLARESRRISKMSFSETWKSGGNTLGLFFIRVLERSERVYLSSLARGGGYRAYSKPFRFSLSEGFFTTSVILFIWWFI